MSTEDTRGPSSKRPAVGPRSTSTVNQKFSHGRSKQVVVEKKKRRGPTTGRGPDKTSGSGNTSGESRVAALAKKLGITEVELMARHKALKAKQAQESTRAEALKKTEDSQTRLATEQKRKAQEQKEREESEARRKQAEEDEKAAKLAEANKTTDDKARPVRKPGATTTTTTTPEADAESSASGRRKGGRHLREQEQRDKQQSSRPKNERRRGKLTITSALGDDTERQRSLASVRRAREKERERREAGEENREKISVEVTLPDSITLQEFAQRMNERVADVIKYMIQQGEVMRGSDIIDTETAELIAAEFGHTVRRVSESDVELGLEGIEDDEKDLVTRPAIVTIMGHVDHGKTSLLDSLRSTDVVAGEAGGITQHIGAYQVRLDDGKRISFLDTPGHAAFSAMRARGANATDIVILVVAANDSVMPQTIEAINHAKAAGVPMIIAVNKVDLHDANPQKVLTDLLQYDVQVEAMGGDVQAIEVSALKKIGLESLTEAITLQAEILELKANPKRPADGVVVESQLDRGRGPVATILVKRGTLKRSDIVVAGTQFGKIRAMIDERGAQLKEAGPSLPVEILGLDGAPDPGEAFVVVQTEARAREITEYRIRSKRQKSGKNNGSARASLDQLLSKLKEGAVQLQQLPIVVKGDVQGSVEAISQSLDKISTEEVQANVIHGAVGAISESDVLLARSSNAPIFAFNVRANKQARDLAEKEGVEIRYYSVIYDLIDDVKATLSGMLAPEKRETFLGYADILQVFNITKVGKVAGCRVSEGKVMRGCGVRLLRDNIVIHEGHLKTLKRFKDEVAEVSSAMECGMAFEKYDDMRQGDRIECFKVEEIARSLD